MSRTIWQINYQFASVAELTKLLTPNVAVHGLVWKIWLLNEAGRRAGGICLFESREPAQAFVNSADIKSLASHPSIANLNARLFTPAAALNKISRAALDAKIPV